MRAAVPLLLLAAVALLPACRSKRATPGEPPPSATAGDAGAPYRVRVRCGAAPCTVDLADDAGRPLGHWAVEHLEPMTAALREHHVTGVVITAGTDVPYATVIAVMDAARAGGAGDIAFGGPLDL